MDQAYSGSLLKLLIELPTIFPKLIKTNWNTLTNIGKIIECIPKMPLPIPIAKLSRERATPKNKASLPSI